MHILGEQLVTQTLQKKSPVLPAAYFSFVGHHLATASGERCAKSDRMSRWRCAKFHGNGDLRSLARHARRVTSKQELKDRVMAAMAFFKQEARDPHLDLRRCRLI